MNKNPYRLKRSLTLPNSPTLPKQYDLTYQTGDESHVLYDLLKSVYILSICCRSPTVVLGWRVSKWWDES